MIAKTHIEFLVIFVASVTLLLARTWADDVKQLDSEQKALDMIAKFADDFCKDVPLAGEGDQIKLTGNGEAQLNILIKKLVDLKIQGAAQYQNDSYRGVLRKDLIGALKDNKECRKMIWLDLRKLIPKSTESSLTPSNNRDRSAPITIHQEIYGNHNVTAADIQGDIHIQH